MQIGLRNVGRRRRRSLATALIVALAVGNLLAVPRPRGRRDRDLASVLGRPPRGRADLDRRASALRRAARSSVIRSTPGVAEAEPVLKNTVALAGREAFVWGVERAPLFRYRLADGRWFSAGEERAREPSRGDRAQHRPDRRRRDRRAGHARDRGRDLRLRVIGIGDEPAGGRNRAVRPADDGSLDARPADRREHLLGQDGVARPRVRRSNHDAGSRTGSTALGYEVAARSSTSPSGTRSPPTARSRPRSPCSGSSSSP